ncbi:MAG: hypothetical protein JWR52_2839 [Marmoricola sp.]|nr:hypothetical protein [Marmoricola sp.]
MSNNEEAARREREDADWRAIVEQYGDVPAFPEPPKAAPEPPVVFEVPAELAASRWDDDEEGYVPPPPPPLPRPRGVRLAAWIGLFGVPGIVVVGLLLNISLPSYVGLLCLAWFVGGFGYLVATMAGPDDPDLGGDDGAVL